MKIPEGYTTVTPYLIVPDCQRLINFLKEVFGAEELFRMGGDDDRIGHCEMQLGTSKLMMADSHPEHPATDVMLYVYVEDVDQTYRKALEKGATSTREPADQAYGDRNAGVRDYAGNIWYMATHKKDVPVEEFAETTTT